MCGGDEDGGVYGLILSSSLICLCHSLLVTFSENVTNKAWHRQTSAGRIAYYFEH
jgi:hypothetical protein